MNANGLINMVIRIVMRQVIGRGINAGIDMATRRRSEGGAPGQGEAAPQDRRQAAEGRETARRAKQAMRVTRRIGRF